MKPEEFGERMGEMVKTHIDRELRPLREKIAKLEAKSRDAMSFRGVFQRAQSYKRGDCVTCDGALWFCVRFIDGSEGKPGTEGNDAWQLTGKSR